METPEVEAEETGELAKQVDLHKDSSDTGKVQISATC